jgi:hypothetical protein
MIKIFQTEHRTNNTNKNKLLFLHGGMGMGDHIICNGLIHTLKIKYHLDEIHIPVSADYMQDMEKLYEDFDYIKIFQVDRADYKKETVNYGIDQSIPLLVITKPRDLNQFDKSFYQQLNFDFSLRWNSFKLPNDLSDSKHFFKNFIKHDRYCLVHREFSDDKWIKILSGNGKLREQYNFDIKTELPIYEIKFGTAEKLLDWVDVIQNAEELHFIDSGPIHLADSLDLNNKKLFYYDIQGKGTIHVRHNWNYVNIF